MTPVGVFFIYPNEDKLGFVNSANLERIHYEVDYVITHCAPSSIVDILGNGGYVHDHLTDFLEEIRERAKFHYWLFGHYHDNRIIDNRFVLLWEQMVQVV